MVIGEDHSSSWEPVWLRENRLQNDLAGASPKGTSFGACFAAFPREKNNHSLENRETLPSPSFASIP